MEQNEYNKEKIIWKNIAFIDNQSVLDMIGLKPCNIMSLIDEESKFPKGKRPEIVRIDPYCYLNFFFLPKIFTQNSNFFMYSIFFLIFKGTDATLLMKLNANHGNKSVFVKPFSDHAVSFGIRHFAGVVMYYSKGNENDYILIRIIKNFFLLCAIKATDKECIYMCQFQPSHFIFQFNNFCKNKKQKQNKTLAKEHSRIHLKSNLCRIFIIALLIQKVIKKNQ